MAPPEPEINYVEYLQSSRTQYIDTGFKPNQNTRVVAEFQFTSIVTSDWQTIFGARGNSSPGSSNDPYAIFLDPSGRLRSDYINTPFCPTSINATQKCSVDKNKNICTVNDTVTTNSTGTFQQVNTLYLFACNAGGNAQHLSNLKIYYLQIYDNETLVRDYAPALDPEGVACLYDKVSGEYVYNFGTGSFMTP